MRTLFIILGFLSGIFAIALSILPFGYIALIPAILGLVFGYLAMTASKKEGRSSIPSNLIFLVSIIALLLTTYRIVFTENKVEADSEFIEKEKESKEEAIEELEEIEVEDIE